MTDAPDPKRLRELEEKIRAAKGAETPEKKVEDHHSQANLAWQMVVELVAGLLIGFGIGYALDSYFETLPWMILIFTLLGFAAGVRVMLRTAEEANRQQMAGQSAETKDE